MRGSHAVDPSLMDPPDPLKLVVRIVRHLGERNKPATLNAVVTASAQEPFKCRLSLDAAREALHGAVKLSLLVSLQGGKVFAPAPSAARLDDVPSPRVATASEMEAELQTLYAPVRPLSFNGNGLLSPPSAPRSPAVGTDRASDDEDLDDDAVNTAQLLQGVEGLRRLDFATARTPTPRTPPARSASQTPKTPQTPLTHEREQKLLERSRSKAGETINFPSGQRTMVAELMVCAERLEGCSEQLVGKMLQLEMQWGSKQANKALSEPFLVHDNGSGIIMAKEVFVTEFECTLPDKTVLPNHMVVCVRSVEPSHDIATRSIDMSEFSKDGQSKTKKFALQKGAKAVALTLTVDTRIVKPESFDEVKEKMASPSQLPDQIAKRKPKGRAAVTSPYVVQQEMSHAHSQQEAQSVAQEHARGLNAAHNMIEKAHRPSPNRMAARKPASAAASPVAVTAVASAPAELRPGKRALSRMLSPSKRSPGTPNGSKAVNSPKQVASPTLRRLGAASGSPLFRRRETEEAPVLANPLFGVALGDIMARERAEDPEAKVPRLVKFLIDELDKCKAETEQGIFRQSMSSEEADRLQSAFDRGMFALPRRDPVIPACMLKRFLNSLPERLCPDYDRCIKIAKNESQTELRAMFDSLPADNQHMLRCLAAMIMRLLPFQATTLMGLSNFAIVFSPAILRHSNMMVAANDSSIVNSFVERLLTMLMCDATTLTPTRSSRPLTCASCVAPLGVGEEGVRSLGRLYHVACAPSASSSSKRVLAKRKSEADDLQIVADTTSPLKGHKMREGTSPGSTIRSPVAGEAEGDAEMDLVIEMTVDENEHTMTL